MRIEDSEIVNFQGQRVHMSEVRKYADEINERLAREHQAKKSAEARQAATPESVLKSAVSANERARKAHKDAIAEAERKLERAVAEFNADRVSKGQRKITAGEVGRFPTLAMLAEEVAALKDAPVEGLVDPVAELAKSDLAPLTKRRADLEASKAAAIEQYATTHRLGMAEAERELAKQRYADEAAGREHWLTRRDREIAEVDEQIAEVRAEASRRLDEADVGKRALREEMAAEAAKAAEETEFAERETPAKRLLKRHLAAKFPGVRYEQALSRGLATDEDTRTLFEIVRAG
jgi:hypothetical protein